MSDHTVYSMTAFARRESQGDFGTLVLELRSVNSRHLEASLRLPDNLRDHEHGWRDTLRQHISRGKVELSLRWEPAAQIEHGLQLNEALVEQFVRSAEHIASLARHSAPVNPTDILAMPGVIVRQSPDAGAVKAAIDELLNATLTDFLAMRAREGAALAALIEARLQGIEQEVGIVRERLPGILAHYQQKLRERLSELKAELVAERVEQELVIFAQRIDVAEELDRLLAHVAEIRRVLQGGGNVGRRLDFLMQELNREANTLGSKAATADSAWSSVELKVLVEQMREQVQNLE